MQTAILDYWWPVTYEFGLIHSEIEVVAAVRPKIYAVHGLTTEATWLEGPLEECFSVLEPLSPAPTKELYFSTTFGWTAFFQNGTRGSDPSLPMLQLSKALCVTALRACVTPTNARYPGVILEVYDTPQAGADDYGYRRIIAAMNDGGRWVFEQSGTPFVFEDISRYRARRLRDRFTADMLATNLECLGIPRLSDYTLQPNGRSKALLLARPPHNHLPSFSLQEVKAQ